MICEKCSKELTNDGDGIVGYLTKKEHLLNEHPGDYLAAEKDMVSTFFKTE